MSLQRDLAQLIEENGPGFSIHVVDERGEPVEGALAGMWGGYLSGDRGVGVNDDKRRTDAAGIVHCDYGRNYLDGGCAVAWHEGRHLAGFAATTANDADDDKAIEIAIHPARLVHGRLTCQKLRPSGESLGWTMVYVHADKLRPFHFGGDDAANFDFLLPAGDYELEACGALYRKVQRSLRVEPGEGDVDIGTIDLPPSLPTLLCGKPAPELRGVVAWKNSAGVKLADLKGRYVILDFWGHWCCPCVANMPKLMSLYDRFPKEQLAIVSLHVGNDSDEQIDTVEKLDAELVNTRKELWNGRDLPFPVALLKAQTTPFVGADGDAGSLAAADYGVERYPTTILIDRDGRIIGEATEYINPDDGFAKLSKLLNEE